MLPIQLVPEDRYTAVMNETVLPALQRQVVEYDSPAVGGGTIRCRLYPVSDSHRCVVLAHGFTESGLKFQELTEYFLQQGISVLCPDHRGHGYSLREGSPDPTIVHVEHFDDYAQDLCAAALSALDRLPSPCTLMLLGHSMGGAISARALELVPDLFSRCVLSSPMLSMNTAPVKPWFGELLAGLFVLFGQGKKRFWIQKPYTPNESFETSCCTSPQRFEWYASLRRQDPALQSSGASYRWIWESLRGQKKILKADALSEIKTPTLVVQAELDDLVFPYGQEKFVHAVPCAQLYRFPGVKHEIYRSPNEQLLRYLTVVFGFLLDEKLPEEES